MKPTTLLALPALALAAATPAKVEERQLPVPLPALPVDPACIAEITGIAECININNPPALLSGLAGCALAFVIEALGCLL